MTYSTTTLEPTPIGSEGPAATLDSRTTQQTLSDGFLLMPGATRIHGQVWYQDNQGVRSVFVGVKPFFTYAIDDAWHHRFCAAQLAEAGLAPIGKIAEVMHLSMSTLRRDRIRLVEQGLMGFAIRTGPQAATKATPAVCDAIIRMFKLGMTKTSIAGTLGLSEGTVRKVLKPLNNNSPADEARQLTTFDEGLDHELRETEGNQQNSHPEHKSTEDIQNQDIPHDDKPTARPSIVFHSESATRPFESNTETLSFVPLDEVEATSIPYATPLDQLLTSLGRIEEAPIGFQDARQVSHAGGLLGLAFLSATGLMQEARTIYGRLKNCWYGLRPFLWTLTLMALLRIKRPENMKEHDPAALGAVIGLPRGPEVKTIRRKLTEVAERGKAADLHRALAKRRAQQRSEVMGTLYIDGHIRDYYGKRKIGRRFLTRKNGTEHGVMDGWVHTQDGQPLFVLHAACDESLTQLFPNLLAELREVVGDDRRVCLVFDRECWSYKLFWKILEAGFDFMTYRKGSYPNIDDGEFREVKTTIDDQRVKYELAEQTFQEEGWPVLRLIAVKRADGGQTQIVASGQQTWLAMGKDAGEPDTPPEHKCYRMFGRWVQENWLKYAKEQFALDVLVDYQTELDDADRLVPNTEWNRRDREVRAAREKLNRCKEKYATELLKAKKEQTVETRQFLRASVRMSAAAYETAKSRRSDVPKTIRLGDCDGRDPIKMSYERKLFSDTVKLCAYDIETMLVALLPASFRKTDHESRTLVRDFLQTGGSLRIERGVLKVSLDQQSAPRYTSALIHVCQQLNQLNPILPESDLRLEFFVNARPVG